MSYTIVRWLNAPIEDDGAFERLSEEYTLSGVDESSDNDTESDCEATEGGAIPVPDSVRDTEGSEGDVAEFNMLTTDLDVTIERAVALPEYVLPEQDDILKATAFVFVYIQSSLKALFNQTRFDHCHCIFCKHSNKYSEFYDYIFSLQICLH